MNDWSGAPWKKINSFELTQLSRCRLIVWTATSQAFLAHTPFSSGKIPGKVEIRLWTTFWAPIRQNISPTANDQNLSSGSNKATKRAPQISYNKNVKLSRNCLFKLVEVSNAQLANAEIEMLDAMGKLAKSREKIVFKLILAKPWHFEQFVQQKLVLTP